MKTLEEALHAVSEAIDVVRAHNCDSAANLLVMAELELRMKVNDISDAELSAFCHELEIRSQPRGMGQVMGQVIPLRPKFETMVRRKST